MLSDSYIGYGVGSLTQDADEMHMLVELLRKEFGAQVRISDTMRRELPHSIMVLSLSACSELLINRLTCVHVQTIVLLGHSTGCQDNVRYMQKYSRETPHLAGVILQAPVSPLSLNHPQQINSRCTTRCTAPKSHSKASKGACRRCNNA